MVKVGRYGKFGLPRISGVQETSKRLVNDTGAACPKCGGKIIERKSKKAGVLWLQRISQM